MAESSGLEDEMADLESDEGFDDDYPQEFPFWYGGKSGPQIIHNQIPLVDSPTALPISLPDHSNERHSNEVKHNRLGHLNSYRDQDSCLHYFISTTQSEVILDEYMTTIIKSFLNDKSLIYASTSTHLEPTPLITIPSKAASSQGMEEYLYHLKSEIIDKSTRTGAPKMIGHMTTALPYFHRPLARLLAALNQNVVKVETAATFTTLERQTIAMLHHAFFQHTPEFYGLYSQSYEHCLGVLCSGGTVANISAMWIARNQALRPNELISCTGVDKEGIVSSMAKYGYKGAVIIGSQLMHYSFRKAADLLGLGEDGLCLIHTDEQFSMRYLLI